MGKRLLFILLLLSGCTVHPLGEKLERLSADQVGEPYIERFENRKLPHLSSTPGLQETIDYALLTNPELEASYWEWRAAIEEIPQAGTEPGNVAIFGGTTLNKGRASLDRTSVTLGNDPMADIVLPMKLSHAAERAFANAKAAGERFQKAKYELRARVIGAYYDYALNNELIKIENLNLSLLKVSRGATEVKSKTGMGSQEDLLKIENELSLSNNDLHSMTARNPVLQANLNALLSREPEAELIVPEFPKSEPLRISDEEFFLVAVEHNPELLALKHEIEGKKEGLTLAKLQYLPDFSVSVGTDLGGIAQNLLGMVTLPLLRYEAIEGGIRQAEATLRETEGMRRKAANDLNARVVLDLTTVHDLDRQLLLFKSEIVPRAEQVATLSRKSYEVGRSSLSNLIDNERSLNAINRLVFNLKVSREKSRADLESSLGQEIAAPN